MELDLSSLLFAFLFPHTFSGVGLVLLVGEDGTISCLLGIHGDMEQFTLEYMVVTGEPEWSIGDVLGVVEVQDLTVLGREATTGFVIQMVGGDSYLVLQDGLVSWIVSYW